MNLFQEQNSQKADSLKSESKFANNTKSFNEQTNSNQVEPISFLEESQEIVIFQSDSKKNSPKSNQALKFESISHEKVEYNNFMLKNSDAKERTTPVDLSKIVASQKLERESPGPKRDTLQSIEKKEIADNNSLHEAPNDEPSSGSEEDSFVSAEDIK